MDPFDRLRAGGIMEMWVSGLGLYAELLEYPELQTLREGENRLKRKIKPRKFRGFCVVHWRAG
jgi:hypothetical protein